MNNDINEYDENHKLLKKTSYNDDDEISDITEYKNEIKIKLAKYFDGEIYLLTEYKDEKVVKEISYMDDEISDITEYKDGEKVKTTNYIDENFSNITEYKDGERIKLTNCTDDEISDIMEFKNDKPSKATTFIDGKIDMIVKYENDEAIQITEYQDGYISSITEYENGIEIKYTTYSETDEINQNKRLNSGLIYVLVNSSIKDMVKIGKTTRTSEERAKEISSTTGVPTPFVVSYECKFNNCSEAEKYIHNQLEKNGYRTSNQREFFNITSSEAIEIIMIAKLKLDN